MITNKMKYRNLLQFLIISLFALGCNSNKTEYQIGDVSYLKIGADITKEELTRICEEFKSEGGIEVDFSKSIFNSRGRLSSLHLEVNMTTQGRSGGCSFWQSPFKSRAGFRIDARSIQYGDVGDMDWGWSEDTMNSKK